jgi:HEAT repeat protein
MDSQESGAPEAPQEPQAQENSSSAAKSAGGPASVGPETRPKSPYSTLWMPLVVVPAVIVIVLVLIFLMFGGIAGGPTSITDNLNVVVNGGKNEREQAAFHLSQKIAENSQAALAGEELPWPVPEDLAETVHAAWAGMPADDPNARFLLASILAEMGDPDGVPYLIELLESTEDDPQNERRFQILAKLGALGDERARGPMLEFAGSKDAGLRSLVAIVLQNIPGEETTVALVGLLGDHELEVRANAAISLSKLGDPAGVEVLFSLLEPELYVAENKANRERFRTGKSVSQSRRAAVMALLRLGRSEDRARLEAWSEDSDLEFRAVVIDAVANWEGAKSAD